MVVRQTNVTADCIETIDHPRIRIDDPGTARSAILLNPDRTKVRRIRMDDCLAPRGAVSADWVVSMARVVDVIVELKGRNVDHAVEQIEATRIYWSKHQEHVTHQSIGAWIICSEYPRASTKVARYRERLRAAGTILLFSTRNAEEKPFSVFAPTTS
jgi:hypothetical protein